MKSRPTIEFRPERPYVGIGAVLAMREFEREIPAMTTTVMAWLGAQGLQPSGRPFLRYRAINMPERMDVELCVPVLHAVHPDDTVRSDALPTGRYAALVYTGVQNGVPANQQLVDWIAAQGAHADSHGSERGEVFAARYETFLTDADEEADQSRWEVEVAILLRDG